VYLGAGVMLRGSACADHAILGPGARVVDSYVGSMAVVESAADRRTVLGGYTALGDEAWIAAGARLHGVHVYPRVRIAADTPAPAGSVFEVSPLRELAAVGEGAL
jgi:carbonic anhydrase/acetyltransferase-like protein (isoleucine patch superfamily)